MPRVAARMCQFRHGVDHYESGISGKTARFYWKRACHNPGIRPEPIHAMVRRIRTAMKTMDSRPYPAWLPYAAFAVSLAAFWPFARIGIDSHHDSIMLKPALDVLSGQALFRQSFTQYGALTS